MTSTDNRPRIIVDTDLGIDDASALHVLLQSNKVHVEALTVVDGNVPLLQAVENCKIILATAGKPKIPIYAGAGFPILKGLQKKELWPGHGTDGLGNITLDEAYKNLVPPGIDAIKTQQLYAPQALVRMVNESPGELKIIALGPLTNIAIAILLDHTFMSKVKSIVVMGGCLFAKGNANRAAEFNIHCDPEAAHIVFEAATPQSDDELSPSAVSPKITLITWEVCLEHGLPWSFFDHLTQEQPVNKLGRFLKGMVTCAEKFCREKHEALDLKCQMLFMPNPALELNPLQSLAKASLVTPALQNGKSLDTNAKAEMLRGRQSSPQKTTAKRNYQEEYMHGANAFMLPDLYAAVACLDPDSIQMYKDWNVQVELQGVNTRGMTHMDWLGIHKIPRPNARVVMGFDLDMIKELLIQTYKSEIH